VNLSLKENKQTKKKERTSCRLLGLHSNSLTLLPISLTQLIDQLKSPLILLLYYNKYLNNNEVLENSQRDKEY
jgi:hypothetical protein